MSIVKSFSFPVGEIRGDCFYIKHDSNNFTVIDCYLKDGDDESCRKDEIINEIKQQSRGKIYRFISTHPDIDHIRGLEALDAVWHIQNFYTVENETPFDDDVSLEKYLELKENHNYPMECGIRRPWLNQAKDNNGSSNIAVLWPEIENPDFLDALENTKQGGSPNNISCLIRYDAPSGEYYLWLGDMETDMQNVFFREKWDIIHPVDVLFQPHHGRESGKVPPGLLDQLDPQIIVVGNAPSEHIHYSNPAKTITQNLAGDIIFKNANGFVHVFTQNDVNNSPECLIQFPDEPVLPGFYYQGSFFARGAEHE